MSRRQTLATFVAIAALAIVPLLMFRNDATVEFGGADGQAADEVSRIDPDHRPWFEPLWSPPGGETESALFALQAALGAGVLGYVAGSLRTRHRLSQDAGGVVDLTDGTIAAQDRVADVPVA